MPRMLFRKTGNAVWISHLDLMRALQRGFRRAGIPLKHTQGFAPHPVFSIALPLSVGVASDCELAEFELDDAADVALASIPERLNRALPKGVEVLRCYEDGKKLKYLKWLTAELTLFYDDGVPPSAVQQIEALFERHSVEVQKQGKNGVSTVDLRPMLRSFAVCRQDAELLLCRAEVSAQNPTLNPLLLAAVIETYLPDARPDFVKCRRIALSDENGDPFE